MDGDANKEGKRVLRYIDFEIPETEDGNRRQLLDRRQLYERFLDRTKHLNLKVWISYAKSEASSGTEEEGIDSEAGEEIDQDSLNEQKKQRLQRARGVFEKAFEHFRTVAPELKEERRMLLEEWLNLESSFGSIGDVSIVQQKLPRKVKRKTAIAPVCVSEDGSTSTGRYEEYYEYIFPDEAAGTGPLKILEAAREWKKQKAAASDED